MATGVGLRIADDECLAAIVTGGGEPGDEASEPYFVVRESVLHMAEDGDTTLGGDPPAGLSHSITGFAAAVGDPAGISVDEGEAYRAEDLLATALFCLIDLAAEHLSGPAEFYAVHPTGWPASEVLALRDALDYLGLRSVVLISEAILPGAQTGREFAAAAAQGALAAVLSTPAGTTPPDPSHAENPLESTDVLPAIQEPMAQAYSAAIPVNRSGAPASVPAPAPAPAPEAEPTATRVAPALVAPPASGLRRTPMLIAAAAAIGLLLGGIAVALLLGGGAPTPAPTVPDARSDLTPTSQPTTTKPPSTTTRRTPVPVVPQPTVRHTVAPQPTTTTPPPPPPTTTTPPSVTAPPSGTTTAPPTTTTPGDPWDAPPSQSPYYPYTFDPYPTFPMPPTYGFPSSGIP